ncbi:hypothetical protein P2N85_05835, partial [Escherichia coli]
MKRAPLITGLLLISTSCAYASSGGCGADSTSGATNYSSVVDDVTVNQTDNVTGRGFAPIFPDTCYHLTHYWPAAADIPV